MLKKISHILCLLCATASMQADTKNEDRVVVKIKDSKNRKADIYSSQVIKIMFNKLQNLRQMPTQEKLQALVTESREELVSLYALYLANKDELLKDKKFLRQVLLSAVMLNKDALVEKKASAMSDSEIAAEYQKIIDQAPVPTQFKVKAAVFTNADKAQRAINALEAGTDFSQILKDSTGEFEDGNIKDTANNSQFVSAFTKDLPNSVKATLQQHNKAGVIKAPIPVTDQSGKTTYWIVKVLKTKQGTKNDFPKFDPKDKMLRNRLAFQAAAKKVLEDGKAFANKLTVEIINNEKAKASVK